MVKTKKKTSLPFHFIIIGIVLIILAVIFVILILKQEPGAPENNLVINTPTDNNNIEEELIDVNEEPGEIFNPEIDSIEIVNNLDTAVATTAGASLITADGKVVNEKGQVVHNNALPMTDFAPKLSEPVDPGTLLEGTVKLQADVNGFTPAEFTVKTGEPITLSLTSVGVGSRLLFENSALIALELPVPADYTMAKTFSAPAPGRYIFFQDMPGRIDQKGVMIVTE
ncbi:hypothetical protein EOL99_04380 [Candidatus Falkowbacteria bacterium]|nr:hypothetical protein [Candidatus Falkowbacteria bacterium]